MLQIRIIVDNMDLNIAQLSNDVLNLTRNVCYCQALDIR